jgi:hypothetical protein
MSFPDLPAFFRDQSLLAAGVLLAVLVVVYLVIKGLRARNSYQRLEMSDAAPLLIPVQRRGTSRPSRVPVEVSGEALAPAAQNGFEVSGSFSRGPESFVAQPNGNGSATPAGAPGDPIMNVFGGGAMPSRPVTASKVVHTIPPMDGTLQFLPGRLEVIEGAGPGRDIRFVRTWGEIPEITFGRVAGPPYRHIQLRSQTVSRQHARMQFVDGRWKLINLSQTNPVIINGDSLGPAHGHRVLKDGDQIEMGEVVFRFRER